MARIIPGPHLQSIKGRIGNIVFYSYYDRGYARIYVKPENPGTIGQITIRRTFGDAVRSWQKLDPEEKNKYNKKARRLPMSGYNLYISDYMKKRITGNINLPMAFSKPLHSMQRAGTSVPASFQSTDSLYAGYEQVIYGAGIG
jgi:hypothetical protein